MMNMNTNIRSNYSTSSNYYIRKRMNRIRRERVVFLQKLGIGLAIVLITVLVMFMIATIHSNAESRNESVKYMKSITVEADSTLYDIAKEYMDPMHYDSIETYIEEVACMNHVEPDHIKEGAMLMVPYFDIACK